MNVVYNPILLQFSSTVYAVYCISQIYPRFKICCKNKFCFTWRLGVIIVKEDHSTRVKWRDRFWGQNEETQVFNTWANPVSKSSVISANLPCCKGILKGKNSKKTKKLRFPVQYVEMWNQQEISTNTSWWSMREMTRDVMRHIEANEHCDICEKIALVWKISTAKRSK